MSNKILFFGNERLATGLSTSAPTLRGLIAAGYEITGVVLAQNDLGQSRQSRAPEIVQLAQKQQIPVLIPGNLTMSRHEIAALGAEIGVLVAYGKLVPADIIELLPRGIVNIHPSLLPRHRGPTPIESVILNGEAETGVSLMQLTVEMDSGPIYAQQSLDLTGQETKQALCDNLQALGTKMLLEVLPGILSDQLQPAPQEPDQATYDHLITKSDGRLDYAKPAVRLEREVRAYAGWPRSRTTVNSIEIIVTQAHVEAGSGPAGQPWTAAKQFGFYTAEAILVVDRLILAGKKEMSAEAFMAGYQISKS
jgi:methionyl-tRNA formyltransferase